MVSSKNYKKWVLEMYQVYSIGTMGRNYANFGQAIQVKVLGSSQVTYTYMLMGRHIY